MNRQKYKTKNVQETIELGKNFAQSLERGVVIFLQGDLGAGKTAFTKGIAKGLEIEDVVNSPTFTILKEYDGRLNLKHIDAYRLEGVDSDSLGLYDLMDDENVVVIEWGEFLNDLDISFDYHIKIAINDEDEREIEVITC
ncbi:tRNA (adenosine(37)-N6)-threonylcarbamoyltransferase complex ATPase subunit type 1 TsaE [Erysipelothrix urinaevulpis]|uniref:tRNA (adenosine(37)-N6)-threonylcarbamoyltransferase complex ATPase subunit type 1 TsaE n=1 Tax=Erysipelothrix urinaevulpis TaxID=2683717 RepID=UPI00135800C1|nr:tRNA (adenosine(37)-N6)-threonylcarbamoyltransferase complex ATPase subunit type 1 TsaE [Erysipelothrix urinaevulpis]